MIEDDFYRTSSQFRLWSFTREQLAERRRQTNQIAAAKVRAQFRRVRLHPGENGGDGEMKGESEGTGLEEAILAPEEELVLVNWGVQKVIDMAEVVRLGEHRIRIPSGVVATAAQLLRRFYTSTSPMTYHPRPLLPCFLFLAGKADHFALKLSTLVTQLNAEMGTTITEEDVKAPEFLILQGLRFTLDVKHPFRGLGGGVVEMRRFAKEGTLGSGGGEARVNSAADEVKKVLRREAQETDVYFLYTPAQIWLGGCWGVDEELTRAYLDAKFKELGGKVDKAWKTKVLHTIQQCSEELGRWEDPDGKKAMRAAKRVEVKLKVCNDPDKMDIVAIMRAKKVEKREGSESDREAKAKKRKVAKDGDVFGGELKDVKNG